MGIVCAIGNDAQQVLASLRDGKSGISGIKYLKTSHTDIPVGEVKLSNGQMGRMLGVGDVSVISRTSLMGAIAVRQAMEHAGLGDISGKRVVLISGTTVGDMDVTEQHFSELLECDGNPAFPSSNECGNSTMEIARLSGLENAECTTISTACSSALNAIILGSSMLARDEADIVIAGGSEALSKFHLNGFNTLMILDGERCRPFDDTRAGLNLGEGAAFVVLEKNARNPLAYICGYGNRCDAFHQTASSDNGEGAFLAMSDALSMAGMQPSDIRYINAHGTGTPNNDVSESTAIKRVFDDGVPAVSSTKSFTGHTTSASGSIETVICILAMQNGFIPGNLGWKNPIPGGIVPCLGADGVQLDSVMCNSFGFGGNDSSLVISSREEMAQRFCEEEVSKGIGVKLLAEDSITDSVDAQALKEFYTPIESRRMGKIMKAAMLSSLRALRSAGMETTDAIISATSRGMLEISYQFLSDIDANDEQLLKPTLFMQSTHNTIGSAIAIKTGCHGYNITYSHGYASEKWAVRDAERLISSGKARSVLVCSFDESTESFNSICERKGVQQPSMISVHTMILTKDEK